MLHQSSNHWIRKFHSKPPAPFEIERKGEVAHLDYSLSGNILVLAHTEVLKNGFTWDLRLIYQRLLPNGRESTT